MYRQAGVGWGVRQDWVVVGTQVSMGQGLSKWGGAGKDRYSWPHNVQ